MQQTILGRTGLSVSQLGLGTMTWSRDTDEHEARDQLGAFLEAGGNLIDTSASYADGGSELLLGALLSEGIRREDVVVVSKAGTRRTPDGAVPDTSRRNLLATLDNSLRRLNTDHLDLWLVQRPDRNTPVGEIAATLDYAVRSGKVRYVGVTNYPAWLMTQLNSLLSGGVLGAGLAATEVEYHLLERGIEREVAPAARAQGIGVISWSALGRGVLTGKYLKAIPADSRAASTHLSGFVSPYLGAQFQPIVSALHTAAQGLEVTALAVALAWQRQAIADAYLVGARTSAQFEQVLAANLEEVPGQILDALSEVSAPVVGYPERMGN